MDLNETLAFVAVARTGSFTAAGKRLGAPKATVSRRVARLEARLAARLLERTTRRVGLTAAGRAYFERCEHAIAAIENAERAARDVSGVVRGTLRVTAPFDFARDRLATWLPDLRRKHPRLELVLELTQRRVDLVAEGIDVALRAGPRLEDASLIARKLASSALVLCASPRYLARRGTPRTIADLADHDLIAIGGAAAGRRSIRLDGPNGSEELPVAPWLVANELGFLREATLAGLGVGLLEEHDAAPHLRGRRLRRVLPDHSLAGGAMWAVYPSSHHLSPTVRAFIDFLVAKLGAPGVVGKALTRPRSRASSRR
jgi:DNA-binding transcriptional LysR family regulator